MNTMPHKLKTADEKKSYWQDLHRDCFACGISNSLGLHLQSLRHGVTHAVCLGLVDGAFRRLQAAGISVLHAGDKRRIAQLFAGDTLQNLSPFDPAKLCDHHHHE